MNRVISISALTAATALLSFNVMAGQGNGAPSGPHYNLNIIGVENPKKADMTGSQRHTIFMPLHTSGSGKPTSTNNNVQIEGQIWLTAGNRFEVCDGNGFDEAYIGDCEDINWDQDWNYDDVVSRKQGAVFALPCNTNLSGYWDSDGDGKVETNGDDNTVVLISCNETVDTTTGVIVPVDETDVVPTAHYQVWARALGSPHDASATVTTCATVQGELQCSLENTVLTREKGKSSFTDVTNQLTSLVVLYCWQYDEFDVCTDWRTTRVALFAGDTEDWFWNYDNNGLRLAQLRFYEVPQD